MDAPFDIHVQKSNCRSCAVHLPRRPEACHSTRASCRCSLCLHWESKLKTTAFESDMKDWISNVRGQCCLLLASSLSFVQQNPFLYLSMTFRFGTVRPNRSQGITRSAFANTFELHREVHSYKWHVSRVELFELSGNE